MIGNYKIFLIVNLGIMTGSWLELDEAHYWLDDIICNWSLVFFYDDFQMICFAFMQRTTYHSVL